MGSAFKTLYAVEDFVPVFASVYSGSGTGSFADVWKKIIATSITLSKKSEMTAIATADFYHGSALTAVGRMRIDGNVQGAEIFSYCAGSNQRAFIGNTYGSVLSSGTYSIEFWILNAANTNTATMGGISLSVIAVPTDA
jgi:hypothetical protein